MTSSAEDPRCVEIQEKICLTSQLEDKNATLEEDDSSFFIGDIGDVIRKHRLWQSCLPRVEPFYAVKCNPLKPVIKVLVDMGLSFDCASKNEIETILNFGVPASKIIFANPCKSTSFIRYAASKGVDFMTFDSKDELLKTKDGFPTARLLLRILPPKFNVTVNLNDKFGCHASNVRNLLQTAKYLNLSVVGISFHVGSGCRDAMAYEAAIKQSRHAFDIGLEMGHGMAILDIGGGFPGFETPDIKFEEVATVVNMSLDKYFGDVKIKIIAEPGRFYLASAFSIATKITTKKQVHREHGDYDIELDPCALNNTYIMYYTNDGTYGSFCNARISPGCFVPLLFKAYDTSKVFKSCIWGPTCGLDVIIEDINLPELNTGDWIYYKNMGAYTFCKTSSFNGMPHAKEFYMCEKKMWESVYPCPRRDVSDKEEIHRIL